MLKSAVRFSCLALILLGFSDCSGQTALPLRASEVLALEVGEALSDNIAYDIATRGLSFHADSQFLELLKTAGAAVVAAVRAGKVLATNQSPPNKELLKQIMNAAVLLKTSAMTRR